MTAQLKRRPRPLAIAVGSTGPWAWRLTAASRRHGSQLPLQPCAVYIPSRQKAKADAGARLAGNSRRPADNRGPPWEKSIAHRSPSLVVVAIDLLEEGLGV